MVGTFFLVLITFGLTLVLITWRKDIKYALLYREAKLVEAEKVLLTDHHHQQEEQVCVGRNRATLPKAPQHRRGPQPIRFLQ